MKQIITIFLLALTPFSLHPFTFALTGDVMMGTTTSPNMLPPDDGSLLFWNAAPTLQSADFAMCNLEGTLCDTDPARRFCRDSSICFHFKTPQHYVRNLLSAGFDAVSIANNHINDFGTEGRDSTVATLTRAGISCTGLRGICETSFILRHGKRIGICSFSHNAVTLDIRNIPFARKLVASMRHRCDYLIVSFHGGAEGSERTHITRQDEFFAGTSRGNVYLFAHYCIDAGADIVFGHGPHVPRALELYKGHLIAYSLGNFCTPYGIGILGVNGYAPLLFVELDDHGKLIRGRIESFIQRKGAGPVRDPNNRAAQLIQSLTFDDFPETKLTFTGNTFKIEDKKK